MEKYFDHLEHQDWKTVVVKKKKDEKPKEIKKKTDPNIKYVEKQVEEDNLKHKKITQELRTKIIQARASQKWKQKDLAQKCNLPISVINDIESGKAIYNPQHINKIKRILKL